MRLRYIPAARIIINAFLTYAAGVIGAMLCIPMMGIPVGVYAMLQRMQLVDHSFGDDDRQIILDISLGLNGVFLILITGFLMRRKLRRLLIADWRLIKITMRCFGNARRAPHTQLTSH